MARENSASEVVGEASPAAARARANASAAPHRLRFHRVGGLDQVVLESAADLLALERLDPKLWVALACPTRGLELDSRTLALLDADGDGRVRVPEILAAIRFCADRLRDPGLLLYGADELPLAALRDDTAEGRASLGAARHVLAQVGRPAAVAVRAEDVADSTRLFENTAFNGDGVVPPDAAPDVDTRQLLLEVIATMGAVPDRSGRVGVDRPHVEAFLKEAAAHVEWWRLGESRAEVMVLCDATRGAHAALTAVRAKVDDFFVRCRLAAMEPRATLVLNRTEPEFAALAAHDLSSADAAVAAFPLARIEPGRALPLADGLNPAWAARVAALRTEVIGPLLGQDRAAISAEEWAAIVPRFAAFEAWLAAKEGARVEALPPARLRAILGGGGPLAVEALLRKDEAFAAEAAAVDDVVRLVHYHRDLGTILRNFVSFADFYDPVRPAVFQAGTLYLDGRSCELCFRVDDPAAHATTAALSRMYLAYCECRRPGGETMRIAACFTQGDAEYLTVGRNGVFYDRRGRDWDATIVRIVEAPISLRQAFFAPYTKALRFVEEQVARFAAARQKATDQRLEAGAAHVADAAAARSQPPPVDIGRMVGIVAALGVGLGALGAVLGGFVAGFMELRPWWAKLVAVASVFLLVSGPSVLVAWLKLRHRTLGPILDASGWAVNGRVRINLPLGAAFTARASLPPGARRILEDPYADRRARRRRRLLALALGLAVAALVAARILGRWPFGPFFWNH
jgi:hypothetical protein